MELFTETLYRFQMKQVSYVNWRKLRKGDIFLYRTYIPYIPEYLLFYEILQIFSILSYLELFTETVNRFQIKQVL